tara:strand:+ start:4354 stop:4974 length:621 start_codon:yes stop_codon:yes gene_type:complete
MEPGHWLSLFAICLLGAMSPGPSLAIVLNTAMRRGRSAGFSCAIAHGAGVALYGLLTVTGLAVLVTRSASVFIVIQLLGAAYLVYLGIKSMRSQAAAQPTQSTNAPANSGSAACDGFLVAFLNPKLAVFMLALFAQFLDPGATTTQKAIMVATVGITDASWYSLIVVVASHRAFLSRLQNNAAIIDRIFGVILIGLAITVVFRALG